MRHAEQKSCTQHCLLFRAQSLCVSLCRSNHEKKRVTDTEPVFCLCSLVVHLCWRLTDVPQLCWAAVKPNVICNSVGSLERDCQHSSLVSRDVQICRQFCFVLLCCGTSALVFCCILCLEKCFLLLSIIPSCFFMCLRVHFFFLFFYVIHHVFIFTRSFMFILCCSCYVFNFFRSRSSCFKLFIMCFIHFVLLFVHVCFCSCVFYLFVIYQSCSDHLSHSFLFHVQLWFACFV